MPLAAAAIGIIFNDTKTQILLIKRKDVPVWVLPGGGIDPSESPEEAVIREVFEETGFSVEIERKCAEYTPTNRLGSFTTVFICRIKEGIPHLSNETADIDFFLLTHLPSSFFMVHKGWLEDALTHSDMIRAPLEGVSYSALIKYTCKHPWQTFRYLYTRLTK